jgi:hypothetical protein
MTRNPFSDPNHFIRDGVRAKDVVVPPRRSVVAPGAAGSRKAASGAFNLEELADCYRISGISYRGEVYRISGISYRGDVGTYELSKSLLPRQTFAEACESSAQACARGEFAVPSAPLQHALIKTLYDHRDDRTACVGIEGMRAFLQGALDDSRVWTLSKAIYAPSGADRVVHEVGLPTEFGVDVALVGADERLKDAPPSSPIYPAVLGDTPANLQAVYRWLVSNHTGNAVYLYCARETPSQDLECGVTCGVRRDGLLVNAHYFDQDYRWHAFGVRRVDTRRGTP